MRKNRCFHEIIYDLLKNIDEYEGIRKTQICSSSNLPIDRCNKLITILEINGLLIKITNNSREKMVLTSRGYAYIGLYEQIERILFKSFTKRSFS